MATATDHPFPECIGKLHGYQPYNTRVADIWALGVILLNMICGRNPWEKACMLDADFQQFINNPDYLYDSFPISEGACDILNATFTLNPLTRITLSKLRKAVLNLETFSRPATRLRKSTTTCTAELEISAPDVPPGLSPPHSRWAAEDDDSPLVTPEGTITGDPASAKGLEKVGWKMGSTAQLLMARHRLEEQFAF